MSTLWLTNVPKEATDDELRALAKKYAPDLECASPSTGGRRRLAAGRRS